MNISRIATLLLLLIGGLSGCTARSAADGKSLVFSLPPQSQLRSSRPQLSVQTGHANSVNALAFSADGKLLASAGGERTIKVWDAGTGTQLRSLEGHRGPIYTVAFSPDGKFIASGSEDGTIKLWDSATGELLRSFNAHASGVYSVVFSPDGKVLASGGAEDTHNEKPYHGIKFWDPKDGEQLRSVDGSIDEVRSLAFSPDGKVIASTQVDDAIILWDAITGKQLRVLKGHAGESVAFSPDGKIVAGGSGAHTIELWDATTGNSLRSMRAEEECRGCCEAEYGTYTSLSVAFSPDGKTIASGACDHTIVVWDALAGKKLRSLKGHTDGVLSVAFSPDGKVLASGGLDQSIKLWDPESGKQTRSFDPHIREIWSIALSPNGNVIAEGRSDGSVKVWDTRTHTRLRSFKGHARRISALAFSPDGRALASGGADNKIKLWNIATGKLIFTVMPNVDPDKCWSEICPRLTSIAFNPNGRLIASGGRSGQGGDFPITLWDARTGKKLRSLSEGSNASYERVVFSPDGKMILATSESNTVSLWNVLTGKLINSFEVADTGALTVSPDGTVIAVEGEDHSVTLLSVKTGELVRSFEGHDDKVTSVAYSPDGKSIISGSSDMTIKLWDVATGKLTRAFEGHTSSVQSIAFSRDGKTILSGSFDGTMKLWRADRDEPLATLIALDQDDWAVVASEGLFESSPGAEKLMHYVLNTPERGYEIIPFEQLKLRFYEPSLLQKLLKGEQLRSVASSLNVGRPRDVQEFAASL